MSELKYITTDIDGYSLEPGRFLIEASAGTGKTFTIANLVRRLIEEKNITMSQLLVSTYTNAAAAELKKRIAEELEEALKKCRKDHPEDTECQLRLRLALASVDDATITTIHGFCNKMLQRYCLEAGIDFKNLKIGGDDECKIRLLRNYMHEEKRFIKVSETYVKKILKNVSPYGRDVEVDSEGEKTEYVNIFKAIQEKLNSEKKKNNIITYDDMVYLFDMALQDKKLAESVRSRYRVIFVDEFQDTSRAQYSIFDKCFPANESPNIMFYMIGDPKQSIYRFQGADIATYLNAKSSAGTHYSLDKNYRSSKYVIEAVNTVFSPDDREKDSLEPNGVAFLQKGIDFMPVKCGKTEGFRMYENDSLIESGMRFKSYANDDVEKDIMGDIAKEIASLLSPGRQVSIEDKDGNRMPLKASDIAILVAKNSEAVSFMKELAKYNISATACKSGRIFGTVQAQWFKYWLKALDETKITVVRQLMFSDFFSLDYTDIAGLDDMAISWLAHFRKLADLFREHGLPAAFTAFLDMEFVGSEGTPRENIMRYEDRDRAMANYLQLMELLHIKSKKENLSLTQLNTYVSLRCSDAANDFSGDNVDELEIESSDDNPEMLRLDRDRAAVQIVTMHSSKGLEYPIVFIPSLFSKCGDKLVVSPFIVWDEIKQKEVLSFHDRHKNNAYNEALQEQVRLMYVALTRGKSMTYVCFKTKPAKQNKDGGYSQRGNNHCSAQSAILLGLKAEADPVDRLNTILNNTFSADSSRISSKSGVFQPFDPEEPKPLKNDSGEEKNVCDGLAAAERPVVRDNWRMMSFSAYGYGGHAAGEDGSAADRSDTAGETADSGKTAQTDTFLSFPRGALVGEFVHGVFERLARGELAQCDFTAFAAGENEKLKERLGDMLSAYRYDRETQLPRLLDGLKRTLTTPLLGLGVPLSVIGHEQCMAETEFFLEGKKLDLGHVIGILQKTASETSRELFSDAAVFTGLKGVLNGIIDLVFEWQGKYYIVDWKTNCLGDKMSDYNESGLRKTMAGAGYILQYHLYSAALCMQMKYRCGSFDYDRFGGVYYLFPRGMGNGENGIWFDRPPKACVNELVKLFTGEGL